MKMRAWILVTLAAAAALLIGIRAYFQSSPRRIAIVCLDRLVAGDTFAVWPHVDPAEAKRMQIDAATFERLMHQYILPTFQKLGEPSNWSDEPAVEPPQGGWWASVEYRKPDGSPKRLAIRAIPSSDGAMLYSFFPPLIMGTMAVRHKLESDTNSYQWQARAIEADGPLLDHLGVHGLWVTERSEGRFFTWGERLTVCKERARILEGRATASTGTSANHAR